MKQILLIFLNALLFLACSSKVQTNTLPDEKKYILPKNTSSKEVKISDEGKKEFEQSLKEFFKVNEKEQENIYDIGLNRGYFKE